MFGFTDLEDRLMGPEGGAELRATLETLRGLRSQVTGLIDKGLPGPDYDNAQLLLSALTAGERILLDTTHLKGAPR